MNVKLNLKVLRQMDADFHQMEVKVLSDKRIKEEIKKKWIEEIHEKRTAIKLLFDHYKTVIDIAEGRG